MAAISMIGTAHSGLEAILAAGVPAAAGKTGGHTQSGSGSDFLASLLAAKGGSADGMGTLKNVVPPVSGATQKTKVATQDASAALGKTPASTAVTVAAVPARSLSAPATNAGDVAAKAAAAADAKKKTAGDNKADSDDAKTAAGTTGTGTPGSQLQSQSSTVISPVPMVVPPVPALQQTPVAVASGKAGARGGAATAKPTIQAMPSFGAAATTAADEAAGAAATAADAKGTSLAATGTSSMVAHLAAAVGGSASGTAEGIAPVVPAWVGAAPSLHSSVERHAGSGLNSAGSTAAEAADAGSGAYASGGFGAPHTLVSTPQVLEVGMTGGAHGWLRVRAELGQAGEVTASLVASNTGSAQSLDKQLGAMSAYLKSESVGVTSLAVTAPEKGAGVDVSAGLSQGAGSSAGQQQRQQQDNAPVFPGFGIDGSVLNDSSAAAVATASPSLSDASTAILPQGSGGWLDVRV